MAKGRKLTVSRSERFLGTFGYNHSQGSTGTDESELQEDDVWSMVDDVTEEKPNSSSSSNGDWTSRVGGGGGGEGGGGVGSTTWSRRRDERHVVGGLSLAFDDPVNGGGGTGMKTGPSRIVHQFRGDDHNGGVASPRGRHQMAASAPVNVPDWSKILRVDSVGSFQDSDDGFDDQDSDMVPPHEYLARAYSRSRKMGDASVVEGVGRTLKGRDMRRVRDAVWSQTGFNG